MRTRNTRFLGDSGNDLMMPLNLRSVNQLRISLEMEKDGKKETPIHKHLMQRHGNNSSLASYQPSMRLTTIKSRSKQKQRRNIKQFLKEEESVFDNLGASKRPSVQPMQRCASIQSQEFKKYRNQSVESDTASVIY